MIHPERQELNMLSRWTADEHWDKDDIGDCDAESLLRQGVNQFINTTLSSPSPAVENIAKRHINATPCQWNPVLSDPPIHALSKSLL